MEPLLKKTGLQDKQSNVRGLTSMIFRKSPDPKSDGVEPNSQLIFTNNNKWYLHSAYVGLSICAVYMTLATTALYRDFYLGHLASEITPDHPLVFATIGYTFGLVLLYLTRQLVNRSLFRIYYHPTTNMFTGIEFTWLMTKNRVTFTSENVKTVEQNSFLQELGGNFLIKQKLYYLPKKDFKSPLFYNIMIGLIKPEVIESK